MQFGQLTQCLRTFLVGGSVESTVFMDRLRFSLPSLTPCETLKSMQTDAVETERDSILVVT